MRIPENIIHFKAARSSGPGGQNVNKRATKVHLWVSMAELPLNDFEKAMIREKLAHHISKDDNLWLEVEEERTQEANKEIAIERLNRLIEEALHESLPRIPTNPSVAAEERRIAEKKTHGEKKKKRRYVNEIDESPDIPHTC